MKLISRLELERIVRVRRLEAQWKQWHERAITSGDPMTEHRGQIRRLKEAFDDMLGVLPSASGDFARLRDHNDGLDAVYMLWSLFRQSLEQRDLVHAYAMLTLADDVAFDCFAPARNAANRVRGSTGLAPREYPLVQLSERASPFVWPRRQVNPRTAQMSARWQDLLTNARLLLPVPVIELPWAHLGHIPMLAAVAHEVGHCLEEDLQLEPFLTAVLEGQGFDSDHETCWRSWLSEAHADLWGVLGVGPAYAAMLAAALAQDPATIHGATVTSLFPGLYPPVLVRMAMVFHACGALWSDGEALAFLVAIEQLWLDSFGAMEESGPLAQFRGEGVALVDAWLGTPWPAFASAPGAVLTPLAWSEVKSLAENKLLVGGTALAPADKQGLLFVAATTVAWWMDPERMSVPMAPDDPEALENRYVEGRDLSFRGELESLPGVATRDADRARALDLLKRFLPSLESSCL